MLSSIIYKHIPLILILFVFAVLCFKKKFRLDTTLTIVVLALVGFIGFSDRLFFLFFICLFIMGMIKLIVHGTKNNGDLIGYAPANFLYSGLPSIIAGVAAHYFNSHYMLELASAVALGTVLSDTISSDIGTKMKGKTYLITNLKSVPAGIDGGISLYGTVAGFVSATIFSTIIYYIYKYSNINALVTLSLIIFTGNLIDSVLGATLQNRGIINNEQVNFLSVILTFLLAILCMS